MHAVRVVLLLGVSAVLVSGQNQLPVKLDAFKNHQCYQLVERERGGGVTQQLYTQCGQTALNLAPELRRKSGKYLLYACITNKLGLLSGGQLNTSKLRSIIDQSNTLSEGEKQRYKSILGQCDQSNADLITCMDRVCPGLLSPVG